MRLCQSAQTRKDKKALQLLESHQVKLLCFTHTAERIFLFFSINKGETTVIYNHKGWSSSWIESVEKHNERQKKRASCGYKETIRWTSAFNKKVDDFNITACKLFLARKGINIPTLTTPMVKFLSKQDCRHFLVEENYGSAHEKRDN